MKPIRILQVTEFFIPSAGGSAQVVYQISRNLTKRGHLVTVLTSNFGQKDIQFPDHNFEILRFLSLPTKWKFYVTPGLISWTRKHLSEFDIIHLHNVRTFQNAVIASQARKRGIPYVLSAHGSLPYLGEHQMAKRAFDFLFTRQLFRSAARLIAVSEEEVNQYRAAGIPNEKIRIIHNGLDCEEFAYIPERGIFRRKFQISEKVKIVLFLGRLHKRKRVDQLIQAFSKMISGEIDARLVIAGPDDGELSSLKSIVTQLDIGEHVIFTGPLFGREKLAAYADADVLTTPAIHEIFGLVPFEAIMCGAPVIVADDCGSGQLIKEAQAGYTVTLGDVHALADTIRHVLSNAEEAKQKVQAGQMYIRENLDWNKLTSKLVEQYQDCIH